jgi:hypothetical protein
VGLLSFGSLIAKSLDDGPDYLYYGCADKETHLNSIDFNVWVNRYVKYDVEDKKIELQDEQSNTVNPNREHLQRCGIYYLNKISATLYSRPSLENKKNDYLDNIKIISDLLDRFAFENAIFKVASVTRLILTLEQFWVDKHILEIQEKEFEDTVKDMQYVAGTSILVGAISIWLGKKLDIESKRKRVKLAKEASKAMVKVLRKGIVHAVRRMGLSALLGASIPTGTMIHLKSDPLKNDQNNLISPLLLVASLDARVYERENETSNELIMELKTMMGAAAVSVLSFMFVDQKKITKVFHNSRFVNFLRLSSGFIKKYEGKIKSRRLAGGFVSIVVSIAAFEVFLKSARSYIGYETNNIMEDRLNEYKKIMVNNKHKDLYKIYHSTSEIINYLSFYYSDSFLDFEFNKQKLFSDYMFWHAEGQFCEKSMVKNPIATAPLFGVSEERGKQNYYKSFNALTDEYQNKQDDILDKIDTVVNLVIDVDEPQLDPFITRLFSLRKQIINKANVDYNYLSLNLYSKKYSKDIEYAQVDSRGGFSNDLVVRCGPLNKGSFRKVEPIQ